MAKPESFEWHGYRFEWDEFDMPHGSKEHYEGWRVTLNGRSYGLLDASPGMAKAELLSKLRRELCAIRAQAERLAILTDTMASDMGCERPLESLHPVGRMPPTD